MYRAVIISCLIAVGYAGAISPVYNGNREIRQTKTKSANSEQSNNPQLPYPTYPDYVKDTESTVSVTGPRPGPPGSQQNPEWTALTPTENNSFLQTIMFAYYMYGASALGTIGRIGNYFLQGLGAVFLATSALGLVCTHTSVCSNFVEPNKVKRFARSISLEQNYPEYLDDFTTILGRALDDYATTKQKRGVEK